MKAVDPKGVLNKSDPDACCEVRKVRPLEPALEGFQAWITGRKRFHGGGRANLPVVEYSEGRYKVNPLADWTHEHVEAYFAERGLPQPSAGGGRLSLDWLLALHGAAGRPQRHPVGPLGGPRKIGMRPAP